jgi:hypothetical protein
VHAVDRNTEGTWSDTAGFAIYMEEPVHDFSLLSPFHGTVIDESTQLPLLFRWERAHTVDPLDTLRYQLHLGRDSHFFEAETLEAGTADSLLVSELEAATWWWRVQVRDQAGNRSWSQQTWMLFQTLAVDGQGRALPTDYALAAPWPNPFNATASVVVALPEPGPLALTLHDLLGRRVAVLAERPHPAGWHRFRLDADRLASGTYFLRAAVPGKLNTTRRITLVK